MDLSHDGSLKPEARGTICSRALFYSTAERLAVAHEHIIDQPEGAIRIATNTCKQNLNHSSRHARTTTDEIDLPLTTALHSHSKARSIIQPHPTASPDPIGMFHKRIHKRIQDFRMRMEVNTRP
ncbi:hypothetical protein VTL71DRAFT_15434 [Oculimacula yallundae]|uniref:Uncharacterized protein n=1 Tax=Oculimacula yallundae TaxID=86028 RepID=A0ABR4CHV9_9HELO